MRTTDRCFPGKCTTETFSHSLTEVDLLLQKYEPFVSHKVCARKRSKLELLLLDNRDHALAPSEHIYLLFNDRHGWTADGCHALLSI